MNIHEQLINTFYTAFTKGDYKTMQKCYHQDAQFSDPVFQGLDSKEVKAMWHMLCENGKDLQVTFGNIGIFDTSAKVTWKAVYSFGKNRRIVHNVIDAQFYFKDGLIIQHIDSFNLWKWSKMALGLPAFLLGWTGFMQEKVRQTAKKQLAQFTKKHPEYI
ncbi:MAG: nuclear transport factor 2 family protein [Calditrichaeota bacterium]|nr:MAG: nuclear transport factor 2 family protein [Calditrichota bacterium]MBL1206403.1 nuclear transport factor 2 family protein [Calditrichota bacterium]NOG46229.1 nuclear transport factor 2 family protein [Calditrichota bacterium]